MISGNQRPSLGNSNYGSGTAPPTNLEPPIRVHIYSDSPAFDGVAKDSIDAADVLMVARANYSTYVWTFWFQCLIAAIPAGLASYGIYLGLTKINLEFVNIREIPFWQIGLFFVFIFEVGVYTFFFTPTIFSALKKNPAAQGLPLIKYYRFSLFGNYLVLTFIIISLALIGVYMHFSLSLLIFILLSYSLPIMSKYKQRPIFALYYSCMLFWKNPLHMSFLVFIGVAGSTVAVYSTWFLLQTLFPNMKTIWVAFFPVFFWLPYLVMLFAECINQGVKIKPGQLKRAI